MNETIMRKKISDAYPGEKWKERVKKMPDYQVAAIYKHMVDKKQII